MAGGGVSQRKWACSQPPLPLHPNTHAHTPLLLLPPPSHRRYGSVRSKWLRVSAVETDLNTGLGTDKQTNQSAVRKSSPRRASRGAHGHGASSSTSHKTPTWVFFLFSFCFLIILCVCLRVKNEDILIGHVSYGELTRQAARR